MIKNLSHLKNKHKGETCYLFGDGPSIREFDYSKFTDHIGISCGLQIYHNDFNQLNVKYHQLVEPYIFYPDWLIHKKRLQYLKEYRPITNDIRKIIKERKDLFFFINLSNFFAIREPNVIFVHRSLVKKDKIFNNIFENNIDPFGGSLQAGLSLAMLMGFKRIYLVGFDWFTTNQLPYRWYERDVNKVFTNKQRTYDFFDIYQQEMEIINITSEETVCNVQHQSYVDHTGESISLKKVNEIINPEKLALIREVYKSV